jgi:hypothetical protein
MREFVCILSLFGMLVIFNSCSRNVEANTPSDTNQASFTELSQDFYLRRGHLGYDGVSDTSIYNTLPREGLAPGDATQLYTETVWSGDAGSGRHVLLHFDLQYVIDKVGAELANNGGSLGDCESQIIVNRAELILLGIVEVGGSTYYMQLSPFSDTAPLFVEAEADWTNASAGNAWAVAGGGSDALKGLYDGEVPGIPGGQDYAIRIKEEIVQSWLCNSVMNKGLFLATAGENAGNRIKFFSSEVARISNRPTLHLNVTIKAAAKK